MDRKQRVRTALARREPDRVPMTMSASTFVVERLKAHLGAATDRELLEALHVDVFDMRGIDYKGAVGARYVGPDDPAISRGWNGEFFCLFGYHEAVVETPFGKSYAMGTPPLAELSVEELERYPWPQADWFDYSTLRGQLEPWSDFAIAATGCSVFQHPTLFRGFERFLLDLAAEPEAAELIMDRTTDFYCGYFRRVFEQVGDLIDVFRIADDLGTNTGLLIGPDMLDRFVAPRVARCTALAHEHGIPVLFHTDGNVRSVIPKLIDWGIDVLDPLQPGIPEMDAAELKREFGDRLAFSGGIDTQDVLARQGVREVRAEVARVIEALAPGGGYLLSPGHPSLQVDVPVANIVAMYEAGLELGR